MYKELKEDRIMIKESPRRKDKVFVRKGHYPVMREIEGLGSLVQVGGTKQHPQYTVIK